MKIFLTGGTGFVGSHVLADILARGVDVTALKRPQSHTKIPLQAGPNWLEKPMDQVMRQDLEGCTCLVHLASTGVTPQKATWDELFYWNVSVPARLFSQAIEARIRKFVVCGTCAEYGTAAERYEMIPPDAPLEPILPYAASKAAFYMFCRTFCIERRVELTYLRLFSAYGEGQHDCNFWPSLRRAAAAGEDFPMTAGDQVRDFIPVEEAARAFGEAVAKPQAAPGVPLVKNLASGQPVSLKKFAESWWGRWHAPGRLLIGALPYPDKEIMRYAAQVCTNP